MTQEVKSGSWTRPPLTPLIVGLETAAKLYPNKPAVHYRVWHPQGKNKEVKVEQWQSCTYSEFWNRVTTLADNVLKYGARPGDRALVFWIPPSQMDVLALMYALLKAGIVIVWLDPRAMSFGDILKNIESLAPRVLFADKIVRRVFRALQIFRGRLKSIKVVLGTKEIKGTAPIPKNIELLDGPQELDMEGGAIMYTTGSTGPPKAVRLTAECLAGQLDAYELAARDVGLGGPGEFVAMHTGMNFNALDLALGNTTVTLPDPANPGRISPAWIEEADRLFRPSVMTASRIVFENLAAASEARKDKSIPYMEHLRLGFAGGAPVTPSLHARMMEALPGLKEFYSAYGCTEGLPLMLSGWNQTYQGSMESDVAQKSIKDGFGVALGNLCPHTEVFLMKLTMVEELDKRGLKTGAISEWDASWACDPGEVGELIISSPSVSPRYVNNAKANATTKIKHPSTGRSMHRTGDLVFKDSKGQLWMMGRVAQVVTVDDMVIPPVCIESLFDGMDGVKRCAFVEASTPRHPIPVIVVLRERSERSKPFKPALFIEKVKLSAKWQRLADLGLKAVEFKDGDEFPMDKRHNSKIKREVLAKWAQHHLGH